MMCISVLSLVIRIENVDLENKRNAGSVLWKSDCRHYTYRKPAVEERELSPSRSFSSIGSGEKLR